MANTFEEIYAPATEPLTIANNANQALYKNHRKWREYARALKVQNEELKEIVLAEQVVAGKLHSDEEFQELKHQHEIELSEQRQYIKSQLEELKNESLPVIPQFVADWIEENKNSVTSLNTAFAMIKNSYKRSGESSEMNLWLNATKNVEEGIKHSELFARAWLDGYTVEQEQLFYLKNKMTNRYLNSVEGIYLEDSKEHGLGYKTKFTQQEIASMEIGSYEQIPVPVESEGE